MTKVLIATEKPFATEAVDKIKAIFNNAGYETVLLENYKEKNDLLKAVAEVDALIIRSDIVDKEVIEAAKNLKIVIRAGAGYDNIDLDAATSKNVVAMNTPGQNANAVAELAIGMMVMIARNNYNGKPGTELKGKKLGVHAYGNVGKRVAAIAKGFDMDIYAFDPYIDKIIMENDGVKVVNSVDDLYSTCQYVSVNIPANEKTKKSINLNLLSKLPKGGVLVNTARKEIINEEDLLKMFATRDDFRYVTDVEPDCGAEIAAKYQGRFFFTPKKMGAQTEEANINAGIAAANQIVNFLEKGDMTFKVN
ncbi:MAG: 3-phosphoglycerate dehydrogenase [Bacteroidales bacterium]|nr:3-phosphoglycerate dehydrogenase [Bacteroidales bacterium]